jgi:hypothetical protein
MRGREVPDPGAGPDRADPAAAARLAERRSHDYVRHGTSTLFAALEIATGQVIAACKPRHRHQEFLASSGRSPGPSRPASCTW